VAKSDLCDSVSLPGGKLTGGTLVGSALKIECLTNGCRSSANDSGSSKPVNPLWGNASLLIASSDLPYFRYGTTGSGAKICELARPRLRPARGTRWLNCADRSAAEFGGLANGGTEFLLRGEFHGTTSVLRSPFHWHVHPNGTPSKSDNSRGQVPP